MNTGAAAAAAAAAAPAAAPAPAKKIRFAVREEEMTEPSFAVEYPGDSRKLGVLRRNPLVPIGAGLTAAVLLAGLFAFNRGSSVWSQRMMRARVVAQGATLGVLGLSVYQVRADKDQGKGLAGALPQ